MPTLTKLIGTPCLLILLTSGINAQELLTNRQIYDYDIGDEFHRDYGLPVPGAYSTTKKEIRNAVHHPKF